MTNGPHLSGSTSVVVVTINTGDEIFLFFFLVSSNNSYYSINYSLRSKYQDMRTPRLGTQGYLT
jgi:hypothetical protein